MRETNDGFVIAEKDLELRAPANCWAPARPAWPVSALQTWPAMPACRPACMTWPSGCWPSSPRWPIAWCSAGSAPPCATPRRKWSGPLHSKGSDRIPDAHPAWRGSTVEPSPCSVAVRAARVSRAWLDSTESSSLPSAGNPFSALLLKLSASGRHYCGSQPCRPHTCNGHHPGPHFVADLKTATMTQIPC